MESTATTSADSSSSGNENPQASPVVPPSTQPSSSPSLPSTNPLSWIVINVAIPIGILIVGGLAILAFGKQEPPVKDPESQTLAARVERLPEAQTLPVRGLGAVGGSLELRVDGVVVPYREIQLATQVAGQIVYKDPACEVGSVVNKGQLLIRIDDTDYKNEVERLKSQKEQEYQAIRELEQEMANTNRLIELATQEVELQDREIKRLAALPSGFASPAELDAAQRTRLQLVNGRVTLENQLAALQQRRNRLEASEAAVATQLSMAQTNLERTEIRAPVSGVIFREDAEVNSFVQRGQVVVTVEDTSKAEVVVNLRPDELFWVLSQDQSPANAGESSNSEADVPTGALSNYKIPETEVLIRFQVAGRSNEMYQWTGRLDRYDGIGVDSVSRTIPVRVIVPDPQLRQLVDPQGRPIDRAAGTISLVRGMFVNVALQLNPKQHLVVIPGVALKPGSTGNRVWKFVKDRAAIKLASDKNEDAAGASDESKVSIATVQGDPGDASSTSQGEAAEADSEPRRFYNAEIENAKSDFSVGDWAVGRIDVLSDVRPIEDARLVQGEMSDGALAIDSKGEASYWICEVPADLLKPGDRLVVSPLASFESGGSVYVRIAANELNAYRASDGKEPAAADGAESVEVPGSTD